MGSKLSPVLGNINCHLMEQDVIEKHMKSGNIIWYGRYVDDVFWCTKKGTDNIILNEINRFDPGHLFLLDKNFTVFYSTKI